MEEKFRNIIQEKLRNQESIPPIGGWNKIKADLPEKKKRAAFWIWLPIGVASMFMVFMAGFHFGSLSNEIKNNANKPSQNQKLISSAETNNSSSENQIVSNSVENIYLEKNQPNISTAKNTTLDNNANFGNQNSSGLHNSNSTEVSENEVVLNQIQTTETEQNANQFEKAIQELNLVSSLLPYENIFISDENAIFLVSDVLEVEPLLKARPMGNREALIAPPPNVKKLYLEWYASALYHKKVVDVNTTDNVQVASFNNMKGFSVNKIGYDMGVSLKKPINDKFVGFSSVEFSKISDYLSYATISNTGTSTVTMVDENTISIKSNTIEETNEIRIEYYNLGINGGGEYKINRRLSVVGGAGITQLLKTNPEEYRNYSTQLNAKVFGGISILCPMNDKINMRIQPLFNYYFREAVREEFSVKPYNYGVRFTFSKI